MLKALRLFVVLPAWGYVLLAACLGWWVFSGDAEKRAREHAISEALHNPAPQFVNLSDFDLSRDVHPNREIAVEGWFGPDDNYPLNQSGNVTSGTAERFIYLLFGRNDPSDARFVRAAIIMTAEEQEFFLRNMERFMGGVSGGGISFSFSGEMRQNPVLKTAALEVLDRERLWRDENFIFIRPWLHGREAALQAKRQPVEINIVGWLIVGVIFLIGCLRFAWPWLAMHPAMSRFFPEIRPEAMVPPAEPQMAAARGDQAKTIFAKVLTNLPGRFAHGTDGMGMPDDKNGGEAEMTVKTDMPRVLNDGRTTTGLGRFLMQRLAGLLGGFGGKSAGVSKAPGVVSSRSGRPVDPFDRLRQDRMG